MLLDTLTVQRAAAPAAAAALCVPVLALLPGLAAAAGHTRGVVRTAAARTIAALAVALPDAILPELLRSSFRSSVHVTQGRQAQGRCLPVLTQAECAAQKGSIHFVPVKVVAGYTRGQWAYDNPRHLS